MTLRTLPPIEPNHPHGSQPGSFVPPDQPADVAVLVVTYNSAARIVPLLDSLRREAATLKIRLVVADNDSTDHTMVDLSEHPDVIAVHTGGNLGYAAGVNAAYRHSGDARTILVLNPDLEVRPGAIATLLSTIDRGVADIVVPRLVDEHGTVEPSLRREPTLGTVVGDALFGARWPQRPAFLSDIDSRPESYRFGHEVDWANGAALMIRAGTAREIGPWDEQFFLYSEETDYFRRARELGAIVRYEPAATMMHAGGGSGSSERQATLLSVNRIRYYRKYHPGLRTALFHSGVILHESLRALVGQRQGKPFTVADEAQWDHLPGPTGSRDPAIVSVDFPAATVIIPAHNEAAVIERTLKVLEPVLGTGRVEVIVSCNGCTDDTAVRASAIPGVKVIELPVASKTAALNAADAVSTTWPRVYLDADISLSPTMLRLVVEALDGPALAARPAFKYDDEGATWPVRAYFRARRRLPSTKTELWGAAVYALSQKGHDRFGSFPDVTADDYFVATQFQRSEVAIVSGPPVLFRTPRDTTSLFKVLRRHYRGPAELREAPSRAEAGKPSDTSAVSQTVKVPGSTSGGTARELLFSVRGPQSAFDAISYAGFAVSPRMRRLSRRRITGERAWERDDSSRI